MSTIEATLTREQSLKLIEQLTESPDRYVRAKALKLVGRLAVPMQDILDKVPGESVSAKARTLKMSRQSWYYWLNGTARPNKRRARQLAKITGYSIAEIRGVEDED